MGATSRWAAMLALVALAAGGEPGTAQEASPAANPFVLDEAGCTVEPRAVDDLATVIASPFPETATADMATVAALLGDDRATFAVPKGEAVAPTAIEPVAATITEFYACLAVGNQLAAAGLSTDTFIRSQIVVSARSQDSPTDAAIASPVPELVPQSSVVIRDLKTLAGGRIGAVVQLALPSGEHRTDYVLVMEQDGRCQVDGVVEGIAA